MIIFAAAGETRGTVTVFTDVDCFYCQKLHREVPALNEAGIEVRYLAYPREGLGGASYRKIATAWCADNPQQVLTQLKNRQAVADNVCPGNPVADQYKLGQQVGVNGTPALVLENGELVPGYMAADALAKRMGVQ
jgi:thiol:disulfide interchange protein DsbC